MVVFVVFFGFGVIFESLCVSFVEVCNSGI